MVSRSCYFPIVTFVCLTSYYHVQAFTTISTSQRHTSTRLSGWLDNFLPKVDDGSKRQMEFPEQYPATYELLTEILPSDEADKNTQLIRPLLKQTMLQERPLQLVYDASQHGWNPTAFHSCVDGKGAAVVLATYNDNNNLVGGYNPKGWSSNGGARPSVAAFCFYQRTTTTDNGVVLQKLRKVGGGGLACAHDDPDYGISFGPDALVIPLQKGRDRRAASKLGPYFDRGPEDLPSLFAGVVVQLDSLQVWTGVYGNDEDIPYSGAVLDMTSG